MDESDYEAFEEAVKGFPFAVIYDLDLLALWEKALLHERKKHKVIGYQFQSKDDRLWCNFMNQKHYEDTVDAGTWRIRSVYVRDPADQDDSETCT